MADHIVGTLKSGVAPLEIEYVIVKTSNFLETIGYRALLKINSVDLGTLYPSQYRLVTNRNAQSVKLASWCFKKTVEDMKKMSEGGKLPSFVSLYVPTKMLMRKLIDKLFSDAGEASELFSNIALEFSSDILLEDTKKVSELLYDIKKKYGITLILSEFGDSFCPTLRLCGLPFDYVVLDETVCTADDLSGDAVKSAVSLAKSCKTEVLLERMAGENVSHLAKKAGCSAYCEYRGKAIDEVLL